jgi:hypothetical protein
MSFLAERMPEVRAITASLDAIGGTALLLPKTMRNRAYILHTSEKMRNDS